MINLSTKERILLEDEKSHEELCVSKYKDYSTKAKDPKLQTLFSQLAQKEQQHLDSINQLLNGVVPNINQQQGHQNQQSGSSMPQLQLNQQASTSLKNISIPSMQNNSYDQNDKMLCQDSLSTEKYVSSTYNTAIFEFKDKNVRQVLNHIQKEEQEHGEEIFNYMSQNGMYNA